MKNIILIMTCLLAWGTSFAQKKGALNGKVVDENQKAIPYAAIKLTHLGDTLLRYQTLTDSIGRYTFTKLSAGSYLLSAKVLNYQEHRQKINFNGENTEIPSIKLVVDAKQLKEINVVGQKPFVERRADKMILNVENNITATGNSVLEVLEKAPGVTIDRQNEQIKLNNKGGITIMIDGKPNVLSGADITTLLSNMSSDQVANIELITNPSAKYDAAGNAGIINIKLKRNKNYGTNGSLSGNAGRASTKNGPNNLYQYGSSLNLNHRTGQWNIFGNANYMTRSRFNTTNLERVVDGTNSSTNFNQNFNRKQKGPAYGAKIGADYYASPKTVIGIMVDVMKADNEMDGLSSTLINEQQGQNSTISYIKQNNFNNGDFKNLTSNLNLKHDINKEGGNISFDVDYANYRMDRGDSFDAQYLNAQQSLTNTSSLRNIIDADIKVFAAKTDFSWPFSKTLKLDAGLKSSFVTTNNDFTSQQLNNGQWTDYLGRSNLFIYRENINAAYTSVAKSWKGWELQAGLRAEHTHSKGKSVTADKEVNRDYISLFPSIFLKQELSKNHSLNYSFGRRIDRPSYQQLNPFSMYLDPYTIDSGNPYLNAQFTQNYEVGYSYKEFSLSLNYSRTKGMITQVSQQNDATKQIEVRRENFGKANLYNANLYFPIKVSKKWSMQNNFSTSYQEYEDASLIGGLFQKSKVGFGFNTTQNFTFSKTFRGEISFWYDSPRVRGVEETTIAQYALNLGVQKTFLQQKLKLRLSMDDILATNYWEGRMKYQNVNMYVTNYYSSRRASLGLSYNFGNQNVKSVRNRKTAIDDIKGRTGG